MLIDISVIIVNYRGWSHLRSCLESLESFGNDSFLFEVIVVDNYSDDGQLGLFEKRFPKFCFILNSGNNGFSNGCNLGAASANGTHLLFLNPDVIATESSILELLQTIRNSPKIMILSCKQLNASGKEEQSCRLFPSFLTLNGLLRSVYRKSRRNEFLAQLSTDNAMIYPDWVSGSLILMSRQHFDSLGGWDESFWLYYEDVDLCFRAMKKGGLVGLHNQIFVVHNHGGTTRINIKTAVLAKTEVIISLHIFLSKHYSKMEAFGLHFLVIAGVLLTKLLPALIGLPFFFIKRLNLYSLLYVRLISYYAGALIKGTWLSPRSIKYVK